MNNEKTETTEEVKDGSFALVAGALQQMTQGEMASQVQIAHQYPRSMVTFQRKALSLATLDDETAESCIYRRPVGKDRDTGEQKMAEGMSIRMAEIVAASYGNLRVYSTTVSQDPRKVTVRGMAIDLESNFASSSEATESTVDRNGRPYSERQAALMEKVAHSKARRDAIFQVVPRAIAKPIEAAVRQVLMGTEKTINARRDAVQQWITKIGIDPQRVFTVLGVGGYAEIGPKELEVLTGIRTAMREGDATLDESFPVIEGANKFTPKPGVASKPKDEDYPPGLEPKQPAPANVVNMPKAEPAKTEPQQQEAPAAPTAPATPEPPAPVPAPSAPPPPAPDPEAPKSANKRVEVKADDLEAVQKMCQLSGVTEAQICGYLKSKQVGGGALDLAELKQKSDKRLAFVRAKFPELVEEFKKMPGVSAQ